jgi:hypothetical protein
LRYADDDPITWPQPFIPYFSHYAAIPQHNSLLEHLIIWWIPTHNYFSCHTHPAAPIYGLGKLADDKFAQLKKSVDFLLERVKHYLVKTPSERQPVILSPFVKLLEHGLARLGSVNTNFRQMEFSVRDVQHIWLEITAILDYMEIYKPRMDGRASSASGVANTIGVFTHDLRVAQDHFTAGLPCWLIRLASDFTNQVIHKVVGLECAERILSFSAHSFSYPVLFTGSASSLQKYHLIYTYAKNFLRAPDPFNTSSDPESVTPSVNTSSSQAHQRIEAPPVASSSTQPFPASSEQPSNTHQPRRGRQKNQHQLRKCTSVCSYHFSPLAGRQQPSGPPSRDKFCPIENNPIVPIPIACWVLALAAVDTNPSRVDARYRSPHDRKYLFPEPGIFANANEVRRATYFATWSAIEPACIYRLCMPWSSVTPLSNQEWRDVLIGDIKSKTPDAKSAQARENARRLLGSALEELDIEINQAPSLTTTPSLPDCEAQKILWKLTELNFRFELLALDKRAHPNGDEDARQDLIAECFGVSTLLATDDQQANSGLGSSDWRQRLPCLLILQRLMRDWEGMKPTPLLLLDRTLTDYLEADVLQLEGAVAGFYTDSFFQFFGRAPIIPAHLP